MSKTTKDWKKFKEESAEQAVDAVDESLDEDLCFDDEDSSPATSQKPVYALDHASYLELEDKLTVAEQQIYDQKEKAVRAMAELANVQRRAALDVENAHRYGLAKIIDSFLPVVDSLEQALQLAEQKADQGMHEGLELTMKLFLSALDKCDVKQLDPLGELFDPQRHEAMSMQEAPGATPNEVLAVFQKGYVLNDRVIRPARVVVAKASS